jgi:hypothetical protein
MKTKTSNAAPNAAEVWKQMEDSLVPRLRLSVLDRSVYSYLLRYTRLEGNSRLHFSIRWLARGIGLSAGPAREALRRLLALDALAAGKLRPPVPSVCRGALQRVPVSPASRTQRVPTPPGPNPFPRRGRPPGSRRLPQIS